MSAWRSFFYFFCCVLVSQPVIATQQVEKLWTYFTLTGNYGNFLYYAEPQLRLVYLPNQFFQQFLVNVGGGTQILPSWQAWVGQTNSADSQDAVPGSSEEYRLWEQLVWSQTFKTIMMISRGRLEERKSLFFPEWAYRFRERIQLNVPMTRKLSLVLMDEAFLNLNQVPWIITDTFDQNRAYIGIEQTLSDNLFFNVGYMNQYLSTQPTQSNHILNIGLRFNIPDPTLT